MTPQLCGSRIEVPDVLVNHAWPSGGRRDPTAMVDAAGIILWCNRWAGAAAAADAPARLPQRLSTIRSCSACFRKPHPCETRVPVRMTQKLFYRICIAKCCSFGSIDFILYTRPFMCRRFGCNPGSI